MLDRTTNRSFPDGVVESGTDWSSAGSRISPLEGGSWKIRVGEVLKGLKEKSGRTWMGGWEDGGLFWDEDLFGGI